MTCRDRRGRFASGYTYRCKVYRFDLWGNERDGFDNNERLPMGREDVTASSPDRAALLVARDYFTGRGYALAEDRTRFMGARGISVEWEDSDERPGSATVHAYSVVYRGQWVGQVHVRDPEPDSPSLDDYPEGGP